MLTCPEAISGQIDRLHDWNGMELGDWNGVELPIAYKHIIQMAKPLELMVVSE